MSEPSPGPWQWIEGYHWAVNDARGLAVADLEWCDSKIKRDEQRANGHLVGAARDLLAACETLARIWDDDEASELPDRTEMAMKDVVAAIAKARGKSE